MIISGFMPMESTVTFGAAPVNWILNPIRAEWILEGSPVARSALLSSSADDMAKTFYWDCTAGRFNWFYHFDETLHILEGSVSLKDASGSTRVVGAGDTVFFPVGSSAEWTVGTYVRKLAFCRTALPPYLVMARGMARRFKRIARGRPRASGDSGLL